MNGFARLKSEIKSELAEISRVVDKIPVLLARLEGGTDDEVAHSAMVDSVAANMHGFYTGAEKIFQMIAGETKEGVPSSPDWHARLLRAMASPIENVRPAVLREQTRGLLDEYLRFRHVFRYAYVFRLDAARLIELGRGVRPAFEALTADLEGFARFLDELTDGLRE